ncbi:hypothetical protein [Streptomyces sp. NBC_01233]|uniref:hypothetical protein n=1 Tax=Streptomyces sp. NBC_01233 TaxID=2903787 RepID=UPI002E14AC8B|nr:hypothetical protein OG332_47595 [Streptomyces sp. NBC_01233]
MTAMPPWWSTAKPTRLITTTVPEPRDGQPPADDDGDWLDRLWADEDLAPAAPAPEADQPEPGDNPELSKDDDPQAAKPWFTPQPGYWPSVPEMPKPSLSDGAKRFLFNVGAGVAGWAFGLTPTFGGWIGDCGRDYSISAALVLGGGICFGIAAFWDRRTRHWYWPLAWIARIPLASAVTALALYAPASQL